MPSFDAVNYSLRPSKSIQRQIIFEDVKRLQAEIDFERLVYIGFGSIWFTDFIMAHKQLSIEDMYSIESHPIGFRRAQFNQPYKTVSVIEGLSSDVLPKLFQNQPLMERSWMIWLDYDYELNESMVADLRSVIENAPANSILLATFNANEKGYGRAPDRPARLRELLGSIVPDELPKDACQDDRLQQTLADLVLDFMTAIGAEIARPGGFVRGFRVIYRDSTPMVTVGGVLPSKGALRTVRSIIDDAAWLSRPVKPIKAPHLTTREAALLQAQLPCVSKLSRASVQLLGFDLEDEQIETFENYYRQYPAFAQIVS